MYVNKLPVQNGSSWVWSMQTYRKPQELWFDIGDVQLLGAVFDTVIELDRCEVVLLLGQLDGLAPAAGRAGAAAVVIHWEALVQLIERGWFGGANGTLGNSSGEPLRRGAVSGGRHVEC